MGCFNETCGISSVPIRSGEKVKMLVIRETDKPDICTPFSMFVPATFMVTGEYDDYGGLKMSPEEQDDFKLMLVYFGLKDLFEEPSSNYPSELEQGFSLRLKDRHSGNNPHHLWFCHQDLWEKLPSLPDDWNDSTLGQQRQERREEIARKLATAMTLAGEGKRDDVFHVVYEINDIFGVHKFRYAHSPINLMANILKHINSGASSVELILSVLVDPYLELLLLHDALLLLQRQLIAPRIFTQSYHEEAQALMGQYILDKAAAYRQEMDE